MLRILIAMAAAGIMAMPAFAGYRYRVIDLGTLGAGEFDVPESRAFGINQSGQVCGQSTIEAFVNQNSVTRHVAFVWLPEEALGLPAGMNSFLPVGNEGLPESVANEISDAGRIAGYEGSSGIGSHIAYVWLPEEALGLDAGRIYIANYDNWSEAWGVIDDEPLAVAGGGEDQGGQCITDPPPEFPDGPDPCCGWWCQDGPNVLYCNIWEFPRAFTWVADDPPTFSKWRGSSNLGAIAYDITRVDDDFIWVGETVGCGSSVSQCDRSATFWTVLGANALTPVQHNEVSANMSTARAINHHGVIVGHCSFDCGIGGNPTVATLWQVITPFELGAVTLTHCLELEEIECANDPDCCPLDTLALGINELADPQVVGYAKFAVPIGAHAMLWEYVDNAWVAEDLNALINPTSNFTVREAHDINDSGWIVGWGQKLGEQVRALLLIPIGTCDADINRDECINYDDILEVLFAWGSCTPGAFCPADANGDFNVDYDDILEILTAWCDGQNGPCCTGCPSQFGGGEGQGGGPPTQEELLTFIVENAPSAQIIIDVLARLAQDSD